MFQTSDEVAMPLSKLQRNVLLAYVNATRVSTDKKIAVVQIGIGKHQLKHPPWVDHLSNHNELPFESQPREIVIFLVMDGFRKEHKGAYRCQSSQT